MDANIKEKNWGSYIWLVKNFQVCWNTWKGNTWKENKFQRQIEILQLFQAERDSIWAPENVQKSWPGLEQQIIDQAPRYGAQDNTEHQPAKGAATITKSGLRKPLPELLTPETHLFKPHVLDLEPHHT